MLSYTRANPREVESLQNWLEGTGCIDEDETSYLERRGDLVSLASSHDHAMKRLEDWVEDRLVQHYKGFRAVRDSKMNKVERKLTEQENTQNRVRGSTSRPTRMCISTRAR